MVVGADSRTTTGSYIVRSLLALIYCLCLLAVGQPCHRQANACPRSYLLLSLGVCCRHTSHRRRRASSSPAICVRILRALASRLCSAAHRPYSPRQVHGGAPPVHTAASIFQKLCYENKDGLSAGIIVAGWDKEVGPSVYNIPLGGGLFRQPWAIGGESETCVND